MHIVSPLLPLWVRQISSKPNNFQRKRASEEKSCQTKSTNFPRCSTYSASNDKISGQRELRKLKLCMYLMNYFHYMCAKNHPNPTFVRVKGLARQKGVKPKNPNFTRCSTYSASNDKISVQREIGKLKLCKNLIKYFHYVCAKNHPNPTILSVKGLAKQEVVKPKIPNFTRCSTYSASQHKILSRVELKKMKFCMCLVNYFHYVCAKFHPKPTISA